MGVPKVSKMSQKWPIFEILSRLARIGSWTDGLGPSSRWSGPKNWDFWTSKNKAGVWVSRGWVKPRPLLYFSDQKVWSRKGDFLRDVVLKMRKNRIFSVLKTAISGLSVGAKQGYTGPQKRAKLAQIWEQKLLENRRFFTLAREAKNR